MHAAPPERETLRRSELARMQGMLLAGVEQLRRFPLDRFIYHGRQVTMPSAVWVDRRQSADFQWKQPYNVALQATGPALDQTYCGTDYLYAYWLLRHYGLDHFPAVVKDHAAVVTKRLEP